MNSLKKYLSIILLLAGVIFTQVASAQSTGGIRLVRCARLI